MAKLSVGVVFGGRSVEHDVSIVTAHQVMDVLAGRHDVVPIYITREGRWYSAPGLHDLEVFKSGRVADAAEEAYISPVAGAGLVIPGGRLRATRKIALDVVVPAIHGTFGEDGTLQGLLEMADIPYTCSGVVGSAVGMDKVAMKAAFEAASLPVVEHVLLEIERYDADPGGVLSEIERAIGYPAFIKPARLGSSVGIGKGRDRDGLARAIDVARRYDRRLLVERSMESCIEINCSVLGGPGHEPIPSLCEQPVAWEEFLSFEDKYLRGGGKRPGAKGQGAGSMAAGSRDAGDGGAPGGMAASERRLPAPISDELTSRVQANALGAFRAIGASGVARVDSFVKEDTGETWVMEINTIPGSFSFYMWEPAGVTFADLLGRLIDVALTTHRIKSDLLFSFESAMLARQGGAKGAAHG